MILIVHLELEDLCWRVGSLLKFLDSAGQDSLEQPAEFLA